MRSFLSSCLCVLLAGCGPLIYANKPPKPAAAKPPAGVAMSPSRKLKLSGMNAGLDGILKIETALTMKGPLLISVINGSNLVKQSNSDATGRMVKLLEPGETIYKVSLALGPGENIIDVMDGNDPMERAALKWTADARMGSRNRMASARTENDDAVKEEPDVVVPAPVAPPAKKGSTKKRSAPPDDGPGDEPAKPKNDLAKYSASGKLSVVGIVDDKQVSLVVGVDPTLNGPITVTIIGDDDKVVATRKKELEESEPSFAQTIPLPDGEYRAIVASAGRKEKDETITLGPWTIAAAPPPPPEAPAEFGPNDFQKSKEGHLSAAVTRINGESNLKVHVEGLAGFKVKVFNAKGEEVESRTIANPDDTKNWDLTVKAAEGDHKISVSSLNEKESVDLAVPKAALLKPADSAAPAAQEAVEYDWGRVRGYFAGGLIFSKEREDFSKSDMFLDFTLDKTYLARPFGPFKNFNTFLNARLTSIPVATAENAETGDGGEGAAEPCNTPDCEGFISSKKAALMQAGIYLPIYGSLTTWYRKVTRQDHSFRWEKNALFIAPLAKGGIMTITGDRETSEGQQFGGDDVFNFYSAGLMLGHYRLHARKKRDGYGNYLMNSYGKPIYEANPNIAPELISWLTITAGRWENFEIMVPTGQKNALGEEIKVRERPLRIEALGRLKIPETPFIVGFDGNFGKGPDDVRFIFGTRFDIGKLMRTLRLAGQQDSLGQSAPAPAATDNTPPQP